MSLEILTPITKIQLKDFPVSDSAYVTPTNTDAVTGVFEQGRWYMHDPNNAGKVKPVEAEDPKVAFAVWSKKGEGSTQALSQVAVIYTGEYEADTDQFDTGASFAIDDALTVVNGKLTPVTASENVHCYVVLPPDQNNNKLRFVVR